MLPLSLLRAAEDKAVLVELKNGETFHGTLVNCDHFMNVNLKDITLTSSDGERFWKIAEAYIRGSTIKYLRVDPKALASVEEVEKASASRRGGYRGGRGGNRGGGRGGGGRGGSRGGSRGGYGNRGRGGASGSRDSQPERQPQQEQGGSGPRRGGRGGGVSRGRGRGQ